MSLRAVIYARCSTEEESQKDALVKQAQEAEEFFARNLMVKSLPWRKACAFLTGLLQSERISTGTFWPSGMQFMRESAGQQIEKGI